MSRHTITRIPSDIQNIFRIYEHACNKFGTVQNLLIRRHLQRAGPYYDRFSRSKLLRQDNHHVIYHPSDFEPVVAEVIAPIFTEPIKLEDNDQFHSRERQTKLHDNALVSEKNISSKQFTDHQAKILSLLASYYSPLSRLPPLKVAFKSFMWYQRLLANTPIMFFLRQKQRLMSDPSLRSANLPLRKFTDDLTKLTSKYINEPTLDKRVRNYHMTLLTTTDLLDLALKTEAQGDLQDENLFADAFWETFENANDPLSGRLREYQLPYVSDHDGNHPLSGAKSFLVTEVIRSLDTIDDPREYLSAFPFDLSYHELFVLTIEAPVIDEDHSELLNLLERHTGLEVCAVRLSVADNSFLGTMEWILAARDNSTQTTYDQLLNMAKRLRTLDRSGVPGVLERIGQWGLLEVHESSSGKGLYMFK